SKDCDRLVRPPHDSRSWSRGSPWSAERGRVRADRAKWRLIGSKQRRDCLQPLGCPLELLLPARNRARPVRVELAVDRPDHLDGLLRWRLGFKSQYRFANAVEVAAGCAGPPFGAHEDEHLLDRRFRLGSFSWRAWARGHRSSVLN